MTTTTFNVILCTDLARNVHFTNKILNVVFVVQIDVKACFPVTKRVNFRIVICVGNLQAATDNSEVGRCQYL